MPVSVGGRWVLGDAQVAQPAAPPPQRRQLTSDDAARAAAAARGVARDARVLSNSLTSARDEAAIELHRAKRLLERAACQLSVRADGTFVSVCVGDDVGSDDERPADALSSPSPSARSASRPPPPDPTEVPPDPVPARAPQPDRSAALSHDPPSGREPAGVLCPPSEPARDVWREPEHPTSETSVSVAAHTSATLGAGWGAAPPDAQRLGAEPPRWEPSDDAGRASWSASAPVNEMPVQADEPCWNAAPDVEADAAPRGVVRSTESMEREVAGRREMMREMDEEIQELRRQLVLEGKTEDVWPTADDIAEELQRRRVEIEKKDAEIREIKGILLQSDVADVSSAAPVSDIDTFLHSLAQEDDAMLAWGS